jgi:putative (di)nucleoside polyphosphate hydrolase
MEQGGAVARDRAGAAERGRRQGALGKLSLFYLSMIFPDLPSPAEAGFAKAGNRFPLFGIMLYHTRARRMKFEDLPYRPCVGLAVFNRDGLVFIGRRGEGPEHIDETHVWQMPQGGIDAGEDPWRAARRELYEETSIRSVEKIGEIADWLTYDIPREIVGQAWKGKYRGQTQKWYALRFTGDENEIDILHPGGGAHKPEFIAWKWEKLERLPGMIIPFKRPVYETVAQGFAHLG